MHDVAVSNRGVRLVNYCFYIGYHDGSGLKCEGCRGVVRAAGGLKVNGRYA